MLERKNKLITMMIMGTLVFALTGCEKKGPAEKAGEKIDNAVSDAGKQIQSAGDRVERAAK